MGWLIRIWAILLLCLLSIGALAQELSPQEEQDKGYIASFISSNLSGVSRTVVISGFAGALSSKATIRVLTVADDTGIWLRMEGLVLDWNRAALLGGAIDITELSADQITIFRAPVSTAKPTSPEAVPFALPDLPVSVNISSLRAAQITLGAPLLGEEVNLGVTGTVSLANGEGSAALVADRIGGQAGQFNVSGSFSNITQILALNMALTEAPDGIVARLLTLPGRPAVDLNLAGTAPIDDYAADLSIATDGTERITGTVGLAALPDPNGGPAGRGFSLDVRGDITPLLAPDYREFFGTDVQLLVQGEREGSGAASLSALQITTASLNLAGTADFSAQGWPERFALKGQIGTEGGDPVLLPVAGAATTVQAMTLDVQFDAGADNGWTGDFALTDFARPGLLIPDLTLSGGGVIVQATEAVPGRFSADLSYAAQGIALDDPALARAIGDTLRGQISLSRANDGPVQIASLTLQGPGIEADVQGTIKGPADGFETQTTVKLVAADAARFDLLTRLDLGRAANLQLISTVRPLDGMFDLALTGQTTDLALGIAALDPLLRGAGTVALQASRDTTGTRISGFSVTTPALTGTGQVDLTSGVSAANFDLALSDIGLSLPGLTGPARLVGKASRDAVGNISADLNATLPGAEAILVATQPALPAGSPFTTELFTSIPDLAAFASLTGLPLHGAVTAGLDGTFQPLTGQTDLRLSANATDLALGIAQLDPLLAGAGTVAGQISGTRLGALSLTDLAVTTAGLTGTGGAMLEAGAIAASFDLTLTDAGRSVPGLTGPAQLTGKARRSASGDLAADLSARLMGAEAIVSLAQTGGSAVKAEVFADLPDLARFASLAGMALHGRATVGVNGTLLADLTQLDLTLSGSSQDVGLGLAQLDPLLAGAGTLEGRILRDGPARLRLEGAALRTPALTAMATANLTDGVASAGFDVTVAQIGLVAPALSGPAQVQGTAQRRADGAISLDATATGPGATVRLRADQAAGAAVLDTDLSVSIASLAPYSALVGQRLSGAVDVTVRGTLALDISQFDLTLAAQTRNLDPGNATAALLLRGAGSVAGRLSRVADQGGLRVQGFQARFPNLVVTGELDGRDGVGTAQFDARLTDIGLFTPEFSGPVTAAGSARRDAAGTWQVDTQATGPGGTNAVIAGQIGRTGLLNLTARGSAPLGLANGVIEPRRISGTAGFALALRGQPALAELRGTVTLSEARLTDPVLLKAISGIGGTVTLSGGQADLALSGNLEGGGSLRLSGGVGLAAPFMANLAVGLNALVLRDPTLYQTTATGTVSVTGPLAGGASIAGLIDLGPTEVQVPSSGVSALGDLPVVRHVDTPGAVQQTLDRAGLSNQGGRVASGGSGAQPFALNLTIRAPARVFIRGRGLDAELGGQVLLGGTTAQVIPSGQFDLLRGRLSILNQRFELTEGSASLQGNFIPVIRLVARTTARTGTVVNVILEGPISEPVVTFISAPELPQDEVLAQLIFGRDLGSITPLQAVQLAAAVGTLAGRGGGGLIEGFRTGLGVDDFDITSDAAGNTALRVGKYLGDNLYTEVTISSGTTEINLNLDLSDDVTVKGSVSSDGDTGLGIFFERDY